MEINKKFTTGKSIYDDSSNENVLGEPVDIKRNIRQLPTIEEYKNIRANI
jgi:hypothetical protein